MYGMKNVTERHWYTSACLLAARMSLRNHAISKTILGFTQAKSPSNAHIALPTTHREALSEDT